MQLLPQSFICLKASGGAGRTAGIPKAATTGGGFVFRTRSGSKSPRQKLDSAKQALKTAEKRGATGSTISRLNRVVNKRKRDVLDWAAGKR
jgi:hypothetical protein